jgi:predicted nucleotidyltransferase
MTIDQNREEILRIAAQHGARNVRVFGSVARGEDQADSDVDLLVEMEDDRSLLDLVGLEQELEELLRRGVDVLTDASIHPALRSRITAEARAL